MRSFLNLFTLFALSVFLSPSVFGQESVNQIKTVAPKAAATSKQKSFSEAFYMPGAGITRLQVVPTLSSREFSAVENATRSDRSKKTTVETYQLKFDHGIEGTDLAVQIGIGAGHAKVTDNGSEYDLSGMTDLNFSLTGAALSEGLNFFYGGTASISPENNLRGSPTKEGNLFSGQNTLTPFLRLEKETINGAMGLGISWKFRTVRKSESADRATTFETRGYNQIGLLGFTEYIRSKYLVGALAEYISVNGAVEEAPQLTKEYEPTVYGRLAVYARFNLIGTFTLMPTISYQDDFRKDKDGVSASQNSVTSVSISLASVF